MRTTVLGQPTNDAYNNKLTEGVPEKLASEAIDWRPEGEYPIENLFVVMMGEMEDLFRYSNEGAVK